MSGVRLAAGPSGGVSSKTLTRQMVACGPTSSGEPPWPHRCPFSASRRTTRARRSCARPSARARASILVTSESLRDADWPRESLDDIFFVKDDDKRWKLDDLILGASHLARRVRASIASCRSTTSISRRRRRCASTCACRAWARRRRATSATSWRCGCAPTRPACAVPPFVHVLNEARVRAFCAACRRRGCSSRGSRPAPSASRRCATRPSCGRSSTRSAIGRRSTCSSSSCPARSSTWTASSTSARCWSAVASRYGRPPFDVSHGGGVFTTQLVERGGAEDRALQAANRAVLTALGLVRGVSHTEFIHGADGQWYFLETSARVGGAHIVELVEAATGMNLWAEWAKVELAGGKSAIRAAAAALRLRRPGDVAGAAGVARPGRVRRSRSGVAAVQAPSRRPHRRLAAARARGRPRRRLCPPARRRYSTYLPPGDSPRD